MMRRCAAVLYAMGNTAAMATAVAAPHNSNSSSSSHASSVRVSLADVPVYLKPSSSARRKPSFYIPRMREERVAFATYSAADFGTALPLFTIMSPSCEYFALRLPLLNAGFHRIAPSMATAMARRGNGGGGGVPCNVQWGRARHILGAPSHSTHATTAAADAAAASCSGHNDTRARHAYSALQHVNHFPRSHSVLGCKRGLALHLRHATAAAAAAVANDSHRRHDSSSSAYDDDDWRERFAFVPRTWLYPQEKAALFAALAAASPQRRFIWKPARGSCGRGICITAGGAANASTWRAVAAHIDATAQRERQQRRQRQQQQQQQQPSGELQYSNYVVQDYLDDPLLLDGRKMDLRLYVLVTSYDPLVVYWHDEGLVRLAAQPYNNNMGNDNDGNDSNDGNFSDMMSSSSCAAATTTGGVAMSAHGDAAAMCAPLRSSACRYSHLTNYSIGRTYASARSHNSNGSHRKGVCNDDHDGDGVHATAAVLQDDDDDASAVASAPELKWSLSRLWSHLDAHHTLPGGDNGGGAASSLPLLRTRAAAQCRVSDVVQQRIAHVIVRTLLAVKASMCAAAASRTSDTAQSNSSSGHARYFELYGFDVMLDAQLQPHLIEVNTLPSLESSSAFDYATKTNVMADALNVCLIEPFERDADVLAQHIPALAGTDVSSSSSSRADAAALLRAPCDALRASVHSLSCSDAQRCAAATMCGNDNNNDNDVAVVHEEVQLRLRDELHAARGFRRIFPPPPPLPSSSSSTSSLLSSSYATVASTMHHEGNGGGGGVSDACAPAWRVDAQRMMREAEAAARLGQLSRLDEYVLQA